MNPKLDKIVPWLTVFAWLLRPYEISFWSETVFYTPQILSSRYSYVSAVIYKFCLIPRILLVCGQILKYLVPKDNIFSYKQSH